MKSTQEPASTSRSSVVIALELTGLNESTDDAVKVRVFSIVEELFAKDEPPNAIEHHLFVVGNQVIRTAPIQPGGTLALWEILDLVHLQTELARTGMFLRGAMTVGETATRADFAVGPAISEAVRLCGGVATVPRVVIDPRVLGELERNPDFRASHHSVEDELAYARNLLRRDSDGAWFVDYLKAFESEAAEPPLYARVLDAHRAHIDDRLKRTTKLDDASRAWTWLSDYHNRVIDELFEQARLSGDERARLRLAPRSPMTYAFPSSATAPERWALPVAPPPVPESEELDVLPILMLLDLATPTPAGEEELLAHVWPEHRSRLVPIRASEHGARGSRTGVPMDWQLCSDAVVKMVQKARKAAEEAGAEPYFYVAGWAALPLFAHMGWELSGWADVTFLNRRWDQGFCDVLRLGRRARPFSDDKRFFSQVGGLDTINEAEGPIAVLVSTRPPRENADAPLFMALQGEAPAGVVRLGAHVWTDSGPRRGELDEHNVTRAAYEIEKALGKLPAVFPNHRGLSVFVDGPASLAFLVGRALTPTVLRYPASVPGFNGMEGGGYYSALMLPYRPGRRPAVGKKCRSVVVLSVETDGGFLGHFKTSLAPLVRTGKLTVWHPQSIEPGKDIDQELRSRLANADVVVPLLSAAFVADDRLMAHVQLAKAEGKPLFPILVRACSLAHTPFQNLAVLPRNGCPIASARDAATTWLEVHQELLAALRVESPP